MEKLQEKDPEFYKFLKENDKELLEFNDSDTGSEMEGSNDGDGDMDEDYDEENEDDDDDKGRSEVRKLCGVIVTLFVNDFPSSKA